MKKRLKPVSDHLFDAIIHVMDRQTFEHLVAQALDELPQEFQSRLNNVEVTVEDWPDRETLRRAAMALCASHSAKRTSLMH